MLVCPQHRLPTSRALHTLDRKPTNGAGSVHCCLSRFVLPSARTCDRPLQRPNVSSPCRTPTAYFGWSMCVWAQTPATRRCYSIIMSPTVLVMWSDGSRRSLPSFWSRSPSGVRCEPSVTWCASTCARWPACASSAGSAAGLAGMTIQCSVWATVCCCVRAQGVLRAQGASMARLQPCCSQVRCGRCAC